MANDDRQLCPDGSCIGLIGPDGRCKECGLAAGAQVANDDADHHADELEDDELDEVEEDEDFEGVEDEDFEDEDDDDEDDDLDDEDLEDEDDEDDEEPVSPELELAHRELCPDGDCIGIIGADGRCKECGTPGRSSRLDPRQRALLTERELDEGVDEGALKSLPGSDPDFARRELCPDGACIGLIGSDGRCNECGKQASKSL